MLLTEPETKPYSNQYLLYVRKCQKEFTMQPVMNMSETTA